MPSSSAEESVPPASGPALASILALQVGAVLIAALYVAREFLVPITVAILLSFVLSPLVNFLRRLRLGTVPSVLISVLIAIGIIGLVGTLIGSQVAQLAGRAPEYAQTIETKVHKVREYAVGKLSGVLPHLGYDVRPNPEQDSRSPSKAPSSSVLPSNETSSAPPTTPLGVIEKYLAPVLSPFATLGI